MKPPNLFRTTAMRMAVRYSLLYGLALVGILITFNWSLTSPVDEQIGSALANNRRAALAAYSLGRTNGVIQFVKQQTAQNELALFLLTDNSGNKLAGNLQQRPDDYESTDKITYVLYSEQNLPIKQFEDEAYLPTTSVTFDSGAELLIVYPVHRAGTLSSIREYLIEFAIPLILLILLIGLSLANSVYRRINTISFTAKEIMRGDMSQRIPLSKRNDEFDALSAQLNAMMDRIQKLIDGLREVSDNIAHDLRSPLNRLRINFEVTLLDARSNEEYRETLNQGVEDVEALLNTFNSLLSIAQVESGNHRSQWKNVNLNQLLYDIIELYEAVAEKQRLEITFSPKKEVSIVASYDLLAQAFSNLLENAIKYTPESCKILVELNSGKADITIKFTDSGQGIPTNEYEHVLKRFVRLDNSRNTPGNGLGLSLVAAVCELHHGSLSFDDANPGLIACVRLPKSKI